MSNNEQNASLLRGPIRRRTGAHAKDERDEHDQRFGDRKERGRKAEVRDMCAGFSDQAYNILNTQSFSLDRMGSGADMFVMEALRNITANLADQRNNREHNRTINPMKLYEMKYTRARNLDKPEFIHIKALQSAGHVVEFETYKTTGKEGRRRPPGWVHSVDGKPFNNVPLVVLDEVKALQLMHQSRPEDSIKRKTKYSPSETRRRELRAIIYSESKTTETEKILLVPDTVATIPVSKNFVLTSSINGAQGEATNTDDLDDASWSIKPHHLQLDNMHNQMLFFQDLEYLNGDDEHKDEVKETEDGMVMNALEPHDQSWNPSADRVLGEDLGVGFPSSPVGANDSGIICPQDPHQSVADEKAHQGIERVCKICKLNFHLDPGNVRYFKDKKLNVPTHCSECRKTRKQEELARRKAKKESEAKARATENTTVVSNERETIDHGEKLATMADVFKHANDLVSKHKLKPKQNVNRRAVDPVIAIKEQSESLVPNLEDDIEQQLGSLPPDEPVPPGIGEPEIQQPLIPAVVQAIVAPEEPQIVRKVTSKATVAVYSQEEQDRNDFYYGSLVDRSNLAMLGMSFFIFLVAIFLNDKFDNVCRANGVVSTWLYDVEYLILTLSVGYLIGRTFYYKIISYYLWRGSHNHSVHACELTGKTYMDHKFISLMGIFGHVSDRYALKHFKFNGYVEVNVYPEVVTAMIEEFSGTSITNTLIKLLSAVVNKNYPTADGYRQEILGHSTVVAYQQLLIKSVKHAQATGDVANGMRCYTPGQI